MKKIPELQAERQRLMLRLEEHSMGIKDEIDAIKRNLSPGYLLESAVDNLTDSMQEGQLGVSISKLAMGLLPIRWSQNPFFNTGIRLAMPWIVDRLIELWQWLNSVISWEGVRETVSETVEEVRETVEEVRHFFKQT